MRSLIEREIKLLIWSNSLSGHRCLQGGEFLADPCLKESAVS